MTASGAADGCFLSGELSSFYVSIRSTFIAELRVFGLTAVCFGFLDRGFSSKKSQRVPVWSRTISVLDKFAKVLCYV